MKLYTITVTVKGYISDSAEAIAKYISKRFADVVQGVEVRGPFEIELQAEGGR